MPFKQIILNRFEHSLGVFSEGVTQWNNFRRFLILLTKYMHCTQVKSIQLGDSILINVVMEIIFRFSMIARRAHEK